ncbi:MAG: universal stress protein [Proteobacteria bacterium]|nr:universal stress protein [Pseudomonadota bacterium]
MPSNILVAVDDSENSQKAVDYVTARLPKDSRVLVYSVVPSTAAACDIQDPSLSPLFKQNRQAFCDMDSAREKMLTKFAENAKTCLVNGGFDAARVEVKVEHKKLGVAQDILNEARAGGFDTIVVGRRGHSAIRQFFFGSVSNKVTQLANDLTVVVVD